MCNKCINHHSELYEDFHHKYELGKEQKEIFAGLCKEEKHKRELKYYCKNNNQLCCVECICKIKGKGSGNILIAMLDIEEIEDEKKSKLKENIKYLEEHSNNIQNDINELKKIYEKLIENKEEIKLKISKKLQM